MIDAIAITLDVDWAEDEVLEDTLSLLDEYDACATFFTTHKTPLFENTRHEVGVHPDYTRNTPSATLSDDFGYRTTLDYKTRLMEYLAFYPEAKGVRTHSLIRSTPLMDIFAEAGLEYASTVCLPGHTHLQPTRLWNGMVEIPFLFEDDLHIRSGASWDLEDFPMEAPGLKVFNFHPNAIYINAESTLRLERVRPYFQIPEMLKTYRNPEYNQTGTRHLLLSLLEYIRSNNLETYTLGQIASYTAVEEPVSI